MFLRIFNTIVLVLFIGCTSASQYNIYADATGTVLIPQKNNSFNNTAKFLAGLPVENEAINPYIDEKFYPKYSDAINKSWNESFEPNRKSISKWRSENLQSNYGLSVFYPFSGPDIIHPLTFYPKAREIVMFGLEPTGGIPNIENVSTTEINQHLKLLLDAINFTLEKAFFITLEMSTNVKHSSLNGTSAIMFFFLARGGYDILNITEISLAEDGNVTDGISADKNAINGVEILFTDKGSRDVKRVRYFTLDVANYSKQLDKFSIYVRKHPPFNSIIKSASYLMSLNNFSKIRNLILDVSSSIIQDDSGVPYNYFKNNNNWAVTHFGRYHKPIPVFAGNYQKELDEDNKLKSIAPIPFVYGYGYGYKDITYHLLLAEKVKKD